MFIDEQVDQRELLYDFQNLYYTVWSPVSRRFTSWTYKPLCRTSERDGGCIHGSRQRCPFILFTS